MKIRLLHTNCVSIAPDVHRRFIELFKKSIQFDRSSTLMIKIQIISQGLIQYNIKLLSNYNIVCRSTKSEAVPRDIRNLLLSSW